MTKQIPWVIKEQTKIKHALLESYIKAWMAILFSAQKRKNIPEKLIYFDAFSGPGIYYADNSKSKLCNGSPLIIAEISNSFVASNNNREILLFCIDTDINCINELRKHLFKLNIFNQKWGTYHGAFNEVLPKVLCQLEENNLTDYPMFFFIDPFGYSGYPLDILARLLIYPRVELFINFMIYDINRFCNEPSFETKMTELFGNNNYKDVLNLSNPEQKYAFLLNLYCSTLKSAGSNFVMPFRVNAPNQGTRARYFLIHASKEYKALQVMKDQMAKLSNNPYNFEALGLPIGQIMLFEHPDKIALRDEIHSYCQDAYPQELNYENLEEWAYINTNGISKTIKEALIELEKNDKIIVIRMRKQHKNTISNGAKIKSFKENI